MGRNKCKKQKTIDEEAEKVQNADAVSKGKVWRSYKKHWLSIYNTSLNRFPNVPVTKLFWHHNLYTEL